jgi:glycogen operon protein
MANGEQNRDGHRHNFSCNYGIEGTTDDQSVNANRRKQRLNMLVTLFFSQGTPMLLGGDEFSNSQAGNNNAYAQDNDTGWLDWSALDADGDFNRSVRTIIQLRHKISLLRQARYLHGRRGNNEEWPDIAWLRPDGTAMRPADWPEADAFSIVLASMSGEESPRAVALLLNPTTLDIDFQLPDPGATEAWHIAFSTDAPSPRGLNECRLNLSTRSVALLLLTGGGAYKKLSARPHVAAPKAL